MTGTYLMESGSVDPNAPRGGDTEKRRAEPWEMEGFLPAGGLRSTAADMGRYATYLLERGLPGYTWATDPETGALWHDGQSFGFSAMLVVTPAAGSATFVATNTPYSVAKLGLDLHRKI